MLAFRIKPHTSFRHWLRIGFMATVLIVLCVGYAALQVVRPASGEEALIPFSVESGEAVKSIGQRLSDASLIRSGYWFEVWVWFTSTERSFIAGNYQLPANANIINITRLLTGGVRPSNEVSATIIEGWTARQIGEYLEQSEIMPAEEFMSYVTARKTLVEFSRAHPDLLDKVDAGMSLEGFLFPDTYRLYVGSSAEQLVKRMIDRFNTKFPDEWREVSREAGRSAYDVLILASIVEREVSAYEDRAMVADIFWRRLEAGMGLEADSTINYITGKKDPAVSASDLRLDSPYNTYRYKGLPPGPISNPGQEAIKAAVFPEPNAYWYFLSTSEGKVIYSATFDEHVQAKRKYL